jgi:hypothetical protein
VNACGSDLRPVVVDRHGRVTVALPAGWRVDVGPPTVAIPAAWRGEPPGVVVTMQRDGVRGDDLAELVCRSALSRLADPVIVDVGRPRRDTEGDDSESDDVEILVAHQHLGLDVTTVERHHCRPDGGRWVVAFTMCDTDLPALLPLASRVVASLAVAA